MDSITPDLQQRILKLRDLYAERGLPEEWFYDILKDIHIWSIYSLRHVGTYSIPDRVKGWFDQIFSGKLLRIGRLQYTATQFGGNVVTLPVQETPERIRIKGIKDTYRWSNGLQLCDYASAGNLFDESNTLCMWLKQRKSGEYHDCSLG